MLNHWANLKLLSGHVNSILDKYTSSRAATIIFVLGTRDIIKVYLCAAVSGFSRFGLYQSEHVPNILYAKLW